MNESDPYEAGYRSRLANCYRILCVASDEARAMWLRGYDDADLMLQLDRPVTTTQE